MPGFLNIVFGAVSSVVTDAYFYLTTLLLSGDGTNGAQNNTFLDSSSNNFTITRNGNTTQGTFSPFSQTGWSVYFDGSNDYIDTPASGVFAPTGDFTIGAHFYLTGLTNSRTIISNWTGNNATDWEIMVTSAGTMQIYTNGSTIRISSSAGAIATNTWYYVALCRSGTTITAYLNGTSIGTYTQSGTFGSSSKKIEIGSEPTGVATFLGYISNVWLVDGQAITDVPTSPITTTFGGATASNVKLLTCQSNRFIDNSNNAFTLTPSGDVSIQAFSPFAPTAAYDAAANGGSGYFDGTGDYLNLGGQSAFAFGTGDFTIQMWFYSTATASAGNQPNIYDGRPSGSAGGTYPTLYITSSNVIAYYTNSAAQITGGTIVLNQWNHIAVARSGTSTKLYLNGAQTGSTYTDSTNYTIGTNRPTVGIDGNTVSGNYFTGYIAGLQVIKGTALYTGATYTIPTAPPTAVTNTQFLANFTNAGIFDSASDTVLETVGNAQISTTQSKFGGSSMYFDGTGDYLLPSTSSAAPNFVFGTGDFTIEMWVYITAGTGVERVLIDFRPTSTDTIIYPAIIVTNANVVSFYAGGFRITGTTTVSLNTWHHVAVSRSGTSTKLFLNGTQEGSTYTDSNNYTVGASRPSIACQGFSIGSNTITGYIDDLRITKGYARYTSNFTAPTAAFALQ